jgi:hypothetical protein
VTLLLITIETAQNPEMMGVDGKEGMVRTSITFPAPPTLTIVAECKQKWTAC